MERETQKAVVVTEIGQPLQLVSDFVIPKPGPDQVLIKVSVAGVNPHDRSARDGGLFIAGKLPAVLANDVVGTVVAVGPGVTKYQIGDRILSHATFTGSGYPQQGLQEYAVNDIGAGCKIPDSISSDEAATLPTNIIAPLFALFASHKGLGIPAPWSSDAENFDYANTAVLIIGGGSSTGKFGVQLAKLAGIGKIVVVGGPEAELKEYGATHVLDRHGGTEAILESIRAVVGDDLEYALDTVNLPSGQLLGLNALSSTKKGKFVRQIPLGPVDESKVIGKTAGFEVIDLLGLSQLNPQLAYPFWERVPDYLTSGKLKPSRFTVKNGLTAGNVNEVLDKYRDQVPVVKTHFHF